MNRLHTLFQKKQINILSVFFTAGYPKLNDTSFILKELEQNGVDLAEIGMPFSDPLADGPVIQHSSQVALQNGMSLKVLFRQLSGIRQHVSMPLILMGYLNPVLSYGIEKFLEDAHRLGIDGIILPDLPPEEYEEQYKSLFEKFSLSNIFLITPQTPDDRIRKIDGLSDSFIYMLSTSATTGTRKSGFDAHRNYFEHIRSMNLAHPLLIGFGIRSRETFEEACRYAAGAIVGTAFIEAISHDEDLSGQISNFVRSIRLK
ncbi:MAG TPA: tryptophan synthase subunit alpha [Bacteroidales bacterium]|nr:tryptophan synthase subunit alpha [Bacteroidales bacterium]HQK36080.1 tryptophan synthase subunit alpha [Bacteroidales bacterium]